MEWSRFAGLLAGILLGTVAGAWAGDSPPAGRGDVRALTAVDSVRTNLWLSKTLMAEIVDHTLTGIRPAPAAIRLEPTGKAGDENLLGQVAFERMSAAGYDVYTAVEDSARQAAVDYVYTFKPASVELVYPRVGRALGLWRQWVDRDLRVSADIRIVEDDSGRLVFDDLVIREFSDRVAADDFPAINSEIYSFTSAELTESGWHRRLEEIVVVGTLTGMVAVYFANTGN